MWRSWLDQKKLSLSTLLHRHRLLLVPPRSERLPYVVVPSTMKGVTHPTARSPPNHPTTPAPSFFSGRHQRWFDASETSGHASDDAFTSRPPTGAVPPATVPPRSQLHGQASYLPPPSVPHEGLEPANTQVPAPTPHLMGAQANAALPPPMAVLLPAPSSTALSIASGAAPQPPSAAAVLPRLQTGISLPSGPAVPRALGSPSPHSMDAHLAQQGLAEPPPPAVVQFVQLGVGWASMLTADVKEYAEVLPLLGNVFPADNRPPPLHAMSEDPHPAYVLEASFPTVRVVGVPYALALTVAPQALALTLPALQGPSPPWMEMMAAVGDRFPMSPALPWATAHLCRMDGGGPAARAREAQCPYWTSAACRVTVYYSSERLTHLSGEVLRAFPHSYHVVRQRDAALRARVSHGCFSALGLSKMFGQELVSPGFGEDANRPLWLTYVVLTTLRHFGQTVGMREVPCDQHSQSMAADLIVVTHPLYE